MKTKRRAEQEKKSISNRKLAIVAAALAAVIVSAVLISRFFFQPSEPEFSFKAAIIDQIGDSYPSDPERTRQFNETVTHLLIGRGFEVTYYPSSNVTVDFYRGLAKHDYGLIVLRSHSAVRLNKKTVDFFTSEPFDYNKYASMIESGLLSMGTYDWEPGRSYFAITPDLVENLDGHFPRSIIIVTGCTSLNNTRTQMAQAFVKKGAHAYIGWTDLVSLSHSDGTAMSFLQYLLNYNKTIGDTVNQCNESPDPNYPGQLAYYPSNVGNDKLADFTTKAVANTLQFATALVLPEKARGLKSRLYIEELKRNGQL
jgi:hypothetical protein